MLLDLDPIYLIPNLSEKTPLSFEYHKSNFKILKGLKDKCYCISQIFSKSHPKEILLKQIGVSQLKYELYDKMLYRI